MARGQNEIIGRHTAGWVTSTWERLLTSRCVASHYHLPRNTTHEHITRFHGHICGYYFLDLNMELHYPKVLCTRCGGGSMTILLAVMISVQQIPKCMQKYTLLRRVRQSHTAAPLSASSAPLAVLTQSYNHRCLSFTMEDGVAYIVKLRWRWCAFIVRRLSPPTIAARMAHGCLEATICQQYRTTHL